MKKSKLGAVIVLAGGLAGWGVTDAQVGVGVLRWGDKENFADGIYEVVRGNQSFQAELITDATPEILTKYKVLIWPQMPLGVVKETPAYQAYDRWFPIVKHWVEEGGGLLVTHDAVGYKCHVPLFPEIAKGSYHDVVGREPFTAELVISHPQPFTPSLQPGDRIPLSYFDYVVLELGPQGRILARGVEKTGDAAKSSGPVVVYGQAGKGRYVANGSLPGLLADGSVVPPSGAEKCLLLDCVSWLAGIVPDPAPAGVDFGAEYELGDKQANLLFNGGVERLNAAGRPRQISLYNAGSMVPDFSVSTQEFHSGQSSARLAVKEFRPGDGGSGKGTVGLIYGEVRSGAFGENSYVIPAANSEYEFSFWVKGDAGNAKQPEGQVLIYAWRAVDGKLTRATIVPKNEKFSVTPDWQKHSVRFYLEGFARIGPMVMIGGTASNIPRKTITGELRPSTDVPVGTAIYLDDAALLCLGAVDHAGLTVEQVRAAAENIVRAEWRDIAGAAVPPLEKVMLGGLVEAPREYLDFPDYQPWPADWKITDLNGVWKIKKLEGTTNNPPDDAGTAQGFWRTEYDASAWPERSVPGTWVTEDKPLAPMAEEYVFDGRLKNADFKGVGWYRRTFELAAKPENKRLILHFDRVHFEAGVWLNGAPIGVDRAGNRPFEFDVTDAVKAGENVLAVRVWRPNEREIYVISDRNYGGIIGAVFLQERPAVYAKALFIDPKISASAISVRAEVWNASDAETSPEFILSVAPDAGNRQLASRQGRAQEFALGQQRLQPGLNELAFTVNLDQPVCWSPDSPHLYTLTLSAGAQAVARERFGFREFGVQSNRYLLNGRGFYPKGIIFDFPSPAPGPWRNQDNLLRRLLAAHKSWGVNMIFIQGEQLFAPRNLYDICDELGILINEWQGATAQKLVKTSAIFQDDITVNRIRYLYNHPAFAMYTIGNESRDKEFIAPINHVYDLVKKVDGQQRPICAVSGGAPQVLRFKEDVVDIHSYPGGIYGHPLDEREVFENANREVWAAHGRLLPLGNWEMGGSKIAMSEREYQQGKKLLNAPVLDKEALAQSLIQFDTGYHMPLGMRWATLYGLRRHCVDAPRRAAADPEFEILRREQPADFQRRESFWVSKYYVEWVAKNLLEDCRRLGELMRGGFGINLGRMYSLFYLRDKEGRLTITPGYPWFESWLMPAGTLGASEIYSTYKRVYNSRFICADVFARNCFAGRKLALTVYAINDTQTDAAGWQARVVLLDQAGNTLADRAAAVGPVAAMQRNLIPFEFDIPADWAAGFYDVRLYLQAGQKVISDNYYEFFVLNQRDLAEPIPSGTRRLAVYDTSNQKTTTAKILGKLDVKFARLADFSRLADYDVLVIGAESYDGVVVAAGEAIKNWLKAGGRLLQFEQYFPNNLSWLPQMSIIKRAGGNVGSLVVAEHPVFAGINAAENWDTWNGRLERTSRGGKQGGIFTALISPLNKTMLAVGCQDTPRATDAAAQMLMAEVKIGRGLALISQAAATFRYDTDSVATKYIQNCMKHILSDETRFAEPLSGLAIRNVDHRRCGYIELSGPAHHPFMAEQAWLDNLQQGLKSCGGLRFKLERPQAVLLTAPVELELPDAMQYMDPEWEAQKQARDHDQGALLKNRVDTLFIMATLPAAPAAGAIVARVKLVYQDGVEAARELVMGRDIAAASAASDLENAVYVGNGFYVTQWLAPRSDVPAAKLVIEPLADGGMILGGVTAALAREKVHGL